jgi:hypothetical protein
MKTYWGAEVSSQGSWPRYQIEASDQPHTPAASPSGDNPGYQLNRKPGGPHSLYGHCGEKKHFLSPGGPDFRYTDWAILAPEINHD